MKQIQVERLTKQFVRPDVRPGRLAAVRRLATRRKVRTTAVDDISFEIGAGELIGFLGPNGAGKSTTIKLLTGILSPTSGSVTVSGIDPSRDRRLNSRQIGVVFGQRTQLWYDLPLIDSFLAIRDLYHIPTRLFVERMMMFSELLALDEFVQTPVRSLSLGQRMRGDLVAAMLHAPPILFLDEPTVGLDVVAKRRIRDFIQETNHISHTTVLITTHDMTDIEHLCHRVIVIDHGQILYDGGLSALRSKVSLLRNLVVQPADPSLVERIESSLAKKVEVKDGRVVLQFDPREVTTPALIADITSRYEIADLLVNEHDLEDVIRTLYERGPQAFGGSEL